MWLLTPKHKVRPMVRTGEEKWKWSINIKWQSQHNGTNSQFDSIPSSNSYSPPTLCLSDNIFWRSAKKNNENINLRFECAQFCTSLSIVMRWMIWCGDKIRCLMERDSEIEVYSKFSLFFYNKHFPFQTQTENKPFLAISMALCWLLSQFWFIHYKQQKWNIRVHFWFLSQQFQFFDNNLR